MKTEPASLEPLAPTEMAACGALLDEASEEAALLQVQLDSLRYASPHYRPGHLFGLGYRLRRVRRRRAASVFNVAWGVGAQDWMLGDRRWLHMEDVAGRLRDGDFVQFGVTVQGGVLHSLRALGHARASGDVLRPVRLALDRLDVIEWAFLVPASTPPDTLPERAQTRVPALRGRFGPRLVAASDWTRWFVEVGHERRRARAAGDALGLGVRPAWPAEDAEVDALEATHGIRLPDELRGFLRASNGASFLGLPLRGTYDTEVLDWPGEPRLLLIEDVDAAGGLLAAEVSPAASARAEQARVYHYAPGAGPPVERWPSLRQCLDELIERALRTGRAAV